MQGTLRRVHVGLLALVSQFRPACTLSVSRQGPQPEPVCFRKAVGCRLLGSRWVDSTDAAECQQKCQVEAACNFFTYSPVTRRCALKISNTTGSGAPDCTEGPKICLGQEPRYNCSEGSVLEWSPGKHSWCLRHRHHTPKKASAKIRVEVNASRQLQLEQLGEQEYRATCSSAPQERSSRLVSSHCGSFLDPQWDTVRRLNSDGREALARGEQRPVVVWQCLSQDLCSGVGDQLRGLLATFYYAVSNQAVFFVDWDRANQSMQELLAPNQMDWRMPDSFDPCLGRREVMSSFPVPDQKRDYGCLFLRTNHNLPPRLMALAGLGEFRAGCAFHFLFQPTAALEKLASEHHPAGMLSRPFRAVHLRFGDQQMSSDAEATPEQHDALSAALQLTADTTLSRCPNDETRRTGPLPVMLYTDSPAVKRLAADKAWLEQHAIAFHVFTSKDPDGTLFNPSHSGFQRIDLEGWHNTMADLWGLTRAVSLVRCYKSGFSRAAAEIALIPFDTEVMIRCWNGKEFEVQPFTNRNEGLV